MAVGRDGIGAYLDRALVLARRVDHVNAQDVLRSVVLRLDVHRRREGLSRLDEHREAKSVDVFGLFAVGLDVGGAEAMGLVEEAPPDVERAAGLDERGLELDHLGLGDAQVEPGLNQLVDGVLEEGICLVESSGRRHFADDTVAAATSKPAAPPLRVGFPRWFRTVVPGI